jgi:hypothetical protein
LGSLLLVVGWVVCCWLLLVEEQYRKVNTRCSIENREHSSIVELLETVVETGRNQEHQKVQIKEERRPGGGLMLGHRGNDWNMNLGVGRVEQRVESTGEWRDVAGGGADQCRNAKDRQERNDGELEDLVKVLGRQQRLDPQHAGVQLQQTKHSECRHVLAGLHGLEADEAHLHRQQRSDRVERAVGNVQARRVAAGEQQEERVHGNQVDDEHVASPRRHHVKVRQRSRRTPEQRAGLDTAYPQKVRNDQCEDGNAFVIERASNRARDVAFVIATAKYTCVCVCVCVSS